MTRLRMMQNSVKQLQNFLKFEIQSKGALSVSDFMGHVLGHPEYGYYITRDPMGAGGDFITAPEVSQIFGDMIGLWLADIWMQMGQPKRFTLLECGPGRGTLMADIMRVTKAVQGFHDAAQVTLLETSPVLKQKQMDALSEYNPKWIENLDEISGEHQILFVANEFFDALPIHQYQFMNSCWHERLIDYAEGKFVWRERNADIDPAQGLNLRAPKNEQILELAPVRNAFMTRLASKLKRQGGVGLVIDYGHLYHAYGDTLQALKDHKFIDVLKHVGDADVTSHVDFSALKGCIIEEGVDVFGMETQGDFLRKLGIQVHTSRLMEKASEQQCADLQKALHRLTHSDEMGMLFKVMGVGHGKNIKAAGF